MDVPRYFDDASSILKMVLQTSSLLQLGEAICTEVRGVHDHTGFLVKRKLDPAAAVISLTRSDESANNLLA